MRRRRSSYQGAAPRRRGGACTTTTLLALALIATGLATALGQVAPSPAESQNQCGVIQVTGKRCDFRAVAGNQALLKIKSPLVRSISGDHSVVAVNGLAGNPLRTLLQRTFAANPAAPNYYLNAPSATVTVTGSNGATAGTSRLVASRQKSVRSGPGPLYRVYFKRGAGLDDLTPSGGFASGSGCDLVIWTPCPSAAPPAGGCEREGEVDFDDGEGCVPVCPPGEVDVGSGCAAPAADACDAGTCITKFENTFDDGAGTCVTACPEGTVPSGDLCVPVSEMACSYADKKCAVGATCPGGTPVSAECADRSAFKENPCACAALQELAAMSDTLQAEAPWNDLANKASCQIGSTLQVQCAKVDGMELPRSVSTGSTGAGLTGALPPSLVELRSLSNFLDLRANAITSLPSEIGILTGLTYLQLSNNDLTSVPTEVGDLTRLRALDLSSNAIKSLPSEIAALTLRTLDLSANELTGVPVEFQTVEPSEVCDLSNNPGFSCANVNFNSACCSPSNNCGSGLNKGGFCHGDTLQAECETPASLFPADGEYGPATPLGTSSRSGGEEPGPKPAKAAQSRIINGNDAKFCAPHFAWLGNCGGTMIAPGLILTAAHCVPSYWTPTSASRIIRLGANKVDRPGGYPHQVQASCCPFGHMTVRATGAVSHPDWAGSSGNKGRFVNDIALIFVEPEGGGDAADIPAEYSVCPSRAALSVGDDPVAMGLGATENDSSGQASWLQHSQHEIYDPSVCAHYRSMELYEGQYAEHFYCTAGGFERPMGFVEEDPDTYTFVCNGDSGSGLMKREGDAWEVAGVVSWGVGWPDDRSTRNCGVYPSSHVNLNHPESVSFIKPYLLEYRAAAGMAQCAGDWSS